MRDLLFTCGLFFLEHRYFHYQHVDLALLGDAGLVQNVDGVFRTGKLNFRLYFSKRCHIGACVSGIRLGVLIIGSTCF